jgi:beta-lactamase class A
MHWELSRRAWLRGGAAALSTACRVSQPCNLRSETAVEPFKWALVAALLARVDRRELALSQELAYGADALLEYAPVTRKNVGRGTMSAEDLAVAAITESDNTAANLLLTLIGGPAAVTSFLRHLGDSQTRLDRNEPSLNSNLPGDPRDTTTPRAMALDLQSVLTGTILSNSSRERLIGWLEACRTGADRLRAGLPAAWRVGHKTGTGENGAVNDVAIAWPAGRAPIVIASYLSESAAPLPALSAAHADIARIIARQLGPTS